MEDYSARLIEADKKYIWHPFTQMAEWLESDPVIIDRGDGFFLIDTEGNRYIDAISSLWCNVHGHRVPAIDQAVRRQLDKISHSTLLGLSQATSIELADRLIAVAPANLSKVFYSDSGATAVEIALKIAYQYYLNLGFKGRDRFIALRESYHGDTIGSVSLGGIRTFHSIFRPLLFETFFVDAPHPYRFDGSAEDCMKNSLAQIEKVLQAHHDRITAIVVEPLVQGAGGIIVHPPGFLAGARELADRHGVLLIADEVATGFGRTGRMFACEHEDVRPDIMCLAKGISGGYLPLAATLTTQEIFEAFLGPKGTNRTFYHGHTYTGNALACAAAVASLDLFEKNHLLESLPEKISLLDRWFEKISKLPFVGDARHCGLMGAVELVADKPTKDPFPAEYGIAAELCAQIRSAGVMLRPLGDCVVVMPPPAIDTDLLEQLLETVYTYTASKLPEIVRSRT